MSRAAATAKKITEKSDKAQKEFFQKVDQIIKANGLDKVTNQKVILDVMNQAAQEYGKIYGRVGMHPLMYIKDGKQAPRYIIDRDELWVLYKPPLWQMGSTEREWIKKVENLRKTKNSLTEAQNDILGSDKVECIQEWHGLSQGTFFIHPDVPVMQWGFIQRLDVDTDGPVIVAKTWRAQRCLQAQMKEHVFTKAYMCLVHGRVENRIQFVKAKFAELGGDERSQVMMKYDVEHDPFYSIHMRGDWSNRSVRTAETFFKPLAYYYRREDNSEYTLVYVNILSGITHQVRITMQSVGHPLVSDDRYLPKEQAHADLAWCPRNFLCEVRSDWFDVFAPYGDESRKKFTRVSIENPLPKLFQMILTNKLTLIEKLDATADLFQGCQYWAIGDEQLMAQEPKTEEFRRKVMRWGQRRGIHLAALDRLLLLSTKDIRSILSTYKSPDKDTYHWVCPLCMGYNTNLHAERFGKDTNQCQGFTGKKCEGTKTWDFDTQPVPAGWHNWLEDPTMHLLMIVNEKWLQARRKILEFERPAWEKPPVELDGQEATDDILLVLEAALVLDAKNGGHGISEMDFKKFPGLEDVRMPLGEPPELSNVRRVRLPGSGAASQWTWTLKGSERVKHTHNYKAKGKKLKEPIEMKPTGMLPAKYLPSRDERARLQKEKHEKEEHEAEEKKKEAEEEKKKLDAEKAARESKKKRKWRKLEMARNPGSFYYFDVETGESQTHKPDDFEDSVPTWTRMASKTNPGEFYYFNKETGETRVDRPIGVVEIVNDDKAAVKKALDEPPPAPAASWKRLESKSHPGKFYYFNSATGENETQPPVVDLPWKLQESKSHKGQWYYFNEKTSETIVDPPASARPAPKASAAKRPAPAAAGEPPAKRPAGGAADRIAEGWEKKESGSHKGKFYYVHSKTGETRWTKPEWEKKESASHPGKYYYVNVVTGETSWDAKK